MYEYISTEKGDNNKNTINLLENRKLFFKKITEQQPLCVVT